MKKKVVLKRMFAVLLALFMVLLVAGCNSKPKGTVSEELVYFEDYEGDETIGGGGDSAKDNSSDKGSSDKTNNKNSSADKGNSTSSTGKDDSKDGSSSKDSGKESNKITILTWWDFSESEKSGVSAWEKKTGNTVKLLKTTQGLYQTKLASLVMSNSAPDAAAMSSKYFPTFINKDLIIPINEYIDVKDKRLALDYMNAAKYNGKYWGMDIKGSTFGQQYVIYYNKTLFESRGETTPTEYWEKNNWNWDTFLTAAQNMTTTKGSKPITGFSVASGSFWEYWSVSTGTSMVGYDAAKSKYTNNYKNKSVIKGWEFANDLLYTYKCAKPQGNLTDGDVAMVGGGQWYMWKGDIYDKNMTDEWSVVPWPSPKGQTSTLPADFQLWCLCNGGKSPKKTVDFLYYWLDLDNRSVETYASSELKKIHKKLWDMKKSFTYAKGPISYSDVNAYDNLMKQLYTKGKSAITTTLDSNSSALNANIQLMEKDKVKLSK